VFFFFFEKLDDRISVAITHLLFLPTSRPQSSHIINQHHRYWYSDHNNNTTNHAPERG
jgi:hypothetical protein